MLTKALRPLPEKWHGLRDPDLQQRRRYLHLATDLEARRPALARAALLRTIRAQLDARGFVEVETPVLQTVAGGANAMPFTTHHQTLDVDMKLRISLELYLKRLMVGGLERVYEIGRIFRNEGIDRDHNPEFTMLELYQGYADYHDIMELTQALLVECARAVARHDHRHVRRPRDPARGRLVPHRPARGREPRGGRAGRRSIAPTSHRSRSASACPWIRVGPGQDRAGALRQARRAHADRADVRHATSLARSRRSPVRTATIRRSPSTSTW